ncbi:MAG: sugar 3,4-ketoisomerase [Mongoliitalea sp.]
MPKIELVRYISFEKHLSGTTELITGSRGSELPFPIERVYYLKGADATDRKGNHANIKNEQVLIAMQGSFQVLVDDGMQQQSFTVNAFDQGLYLPNLTWRTVYDFSPDAICMVFCSEKYDPADYVKDYQDFLELKSNWKKEKIDGLHDF